eukprot:TRINITY_DN13620_c0_g1_i1.p1 TRINITY_DN13620_c0_g1~~TRINITY_DN13620_c0_g1_i1.p1  ORF type:complete len:361 (+),score=65.75 TRINITY_DN13620_c0_g1_i1:271-1353(+)
MHFKVFTFDGATAYFRTRGAQDCQGHLFDDDPRTMLFVRQDVPPPSATSGTDWVDPGWLKLPGKDCYDKEVALTVQNADVAQSFRTAAAQGYQVFSIDNGNAYFRKRTSEDCQGQLFDAPQKTLFVFKVSTTPHPTTTTTLWVDPGWIQLPSKDCYDKEDALRVPNADVKECFRIAASKGYQVFTIFRGNAYFRTRTSQECQSNVFDSTPETTLFVYKDSTPASSTTSAAITTIAPTTLEPESTKPKSWIDVINSAADTSVQQLQTTGTPAPAIADATKPFVVPIVTPAPAITDAAEINSVQAQYDATTAKKQYWLFRPSLPFLTALLALFALGAWVWRKARGRPGVDAMEVDSERGGLE